MRKLGLAAMSVFMATSSAYMQGLSALFILLASLIFQLSVNPYEDEELNRLESYGLMAGCFTLYLGLWTFEKETDFQQEINMTATVLIFAVNIAWGLVAAKAMSKRIEEVGKKALGTLSKLCCSKEATERDVTVSATGDIEHVSPPASPAASSYHPRAEGGSSGSFVVNPLATHGEVPTTHTGTRGRSDLGARTKKGAGAAKKQKKKKTTRALTIDTSG